jgi:hypothetical protein
VSFAATLAKQKLIFIGCMCLLAVAYIALLEMGSAAGLQRRVTQLEHQVRDWQHLLQLSFVSVPSMHSSSCACLCTQMAKKVSWVLQHRDHIKSHLTHVNEQLPVHADGRKHLLIPQGGVSRLAEAMAPYTQMHDFDDHYLCGTHEATESETIKKTIALAAISWMAPLSLRHSMESWRDNGLLDIVDEKMIFLNSPTQADYDIAKEFDFDVYVTDEHGGNIMAGPSLAYLVGNSSADYILLMEKDFLLSAKKDVMMREMYTGVQHLARGVDAYRYADAHACVQALVLRLASTIYMFISFDDAILLMSAATLCELCLQTAWQVRPPCGRHA